MAYYLRSLAANNSFTTIPTVTLSGDFEITIVATQATNGTFLFAGDGVSGNNGLDLYRNNSGTYSVFINTSAVATGSTGATSNFTSPDTVVLRRTGSTVTLLVNGVSQGAATSSATLRVDRLFHRPSWGTFGNMALYSFVISGGSYSTSWDSSNAPSTGTTWTSTGGQVMTEGGTWQAGDAEWVFYSSGASNTATISGSLPKIIGSVSLNEINPINTASVNGQLPKLAGAVSLLQKQSASVAGQLPKLTGSTNLRLKQSASVSGQLPKLSGSIALQSVSNNKQIAVTATLPKITSNIQLSQELTAAVAGQMPKLTADIQLKLAGVYPQADTDAYTYSFRIDGDVFASVAISESIAFNAIIEQQTVIKYAVN